MTKEQEAIERLKLHKDYAQLQNGTCIVNKIDIETVLSMLKEKDKQMDLMAEYIATLDIEEDICIKNKTNPDLCNEDYTNCKSCIKQYFERKSKEC